LEKNLKQYHKLLEDILEHGEDVKDRTGVGTRSIFGYQMRFNLQDGFPAVTTKKLQFKSCVGELLWFLEGSTDERRLAEITYGKHRVDLVGKSTIWTANADAQGKALGYVNNEFTKELGPVYGAQWRKFNGIKHGDWGHDQIVEIINQIRTNPDSRRIILSAWNPLQLAEMALPPCHYAAQFRVINGKLNCMLIQRSGDAGLGIPFNIASYSLLTHILAREVGLEVGDFVHTIGDAHVYHNHIDQVKEQLARVEFPLPKLKIDDSFDLQDRLKNGFRLEDCNLFTLENYQYHPTIKMTMAV
jgi:thymidylate synthase